MCVDCDTYEYSKNCGPECSDHKWDYDPIDVEGDIWSRCYVCGNIRIWEESEYLSKLPFPDRGDS